VLPEAIAEDRATIAALKQRVSDALAEKYEQAAASVGDQAERQRFLLDVASLLYYLKLRDEAMSAEAANAYATGRADSAQFQDPESGDAAPGHYDLGDSVAYWNIARVLRRLDQQYANGEFGEFRSTLTQLSLDGKTRQTK
jgi:hypothetical protein